METQREHKDFINKIQTQRKRKNFLPIQNLNKVSFQTKNKIQMKFTFFIRK